MDLKEIATVSGKSGLFKVFKPTKTGLILETLDEKKAKVITSIYHRVSVLDEISIFTTDGDGSIPLEQVFKTIHQEYRDDTGVTPKSDPQELKSFLKSIVPNYDPERVYVSDIKKLVSWYGILHQFQPEFFHDKKTNKESNLKEPKSKAKPKTKKKPKN